MRVLWNNEEVKVQHCNVYSAPYLEDQLGSFVIIRMNEAGTLQVVEDDADWQAKDVVIRPKSFGLTCEYTGTGVAVKVEKPCSFTVEQEGDMHRALMVFMIGEDTVKKEDYENLIYIKAGTYHGANLEIEKDSTLVYLEDGAVLGKGIVAKGKKHIAVSGGGIIYHGDFAGCEENIQIEHCSDIIIENVSLIDTVGWNCIIQNCEDLLIRRIHIVGCRGNSDGIDVCSSRRVKVEECFTRVWDDSLVVKSHGPNVEDLLFERCVLWNDFARPIEIGVEIQADEVQNVRFHDIDIIHSCTGYPLIGIHHGDHAVVHDICFDDIRIEDVPGAQLFDIRIAKGAFNFDKNPETGYIHDVVFNKIKLVDVQPVSMSKSRVEGMNEKSSVKNVTFSNIDINGYTVSTPEQLGLEIKNFVENVKVIPGDIPELPMIQTALAVSEDFCLGEDGMYRGTVSALLENKSNETISTAAKLVISPSRPGIYENEEVVINLEAGQKEEKKFALTLPAGNFCIHLESPDPRVSMSWIVQENPLVLGTDIESAPKMQFMDCRGVCSGEVQLAFAENYLIVKSDLLKDKKYSLDVYLAEEFEILPNQIIYSSEETDCGMAPAIINGPNGYELAPQLRCPPEILYVFSNEPKVKIIPTSSKSRLNGVAYFNMKKQGFEEPVKSFRLELAAHNDAPCRYPFTLFGSQVPSQMCHMFAKVVVKE